MCPVAIPSQSHGHVTTPLPTHTTLLHTSHMPCRRAPCSCTAMSLPPCSCTHCLAAAHTALPLPTHVAPLTAIHTASPHALQHGHVAASLTVTHVTSPHTSSLHGPHHPPHSCTCRVTTHLAAAWPHCCLPHSCTRCHPSLTCMGHVAARTTLLPPSQPYTLHRPCCPPCSCTHRIAMRLVVA